MKGILVVPVSRVAKVLLPQFESEDAFTVLPMMFLSWIVSCSFMQL